MQRIVFALISLFVLSSCTRQAEKFSDIVIEAPSSKMGIFAALPSGRVACYGVSVKGTGITGTPSTTCKPAAGTFLGFVASGQTIQGQVEKGPQRQFDVYLYLQGTGENIPCASIGSFSSVRPDRLYLIGSVSNITLEKPTETVNIPTTFPGESFNLYAQNSYPTSCIPTSISPASSYQISIDYKTAAAGGYILHGRAGRTNSGVTLTGSGYILKVKE